MLATQGGPRDFTVLKGNVIHVTTDSVFDRKVTLGFVRPVVSNSSHPTMILEKRLPPPCTSNHIGPSTTTVPSRHPYSRGPQEGKRSRLTPFQGSE